MASILKTDAGDHCFEDPDWPLRSQFSRPLDTEALLGGICLGSVLS